MNGQSNNPKTRKKKMQDSLFPELTQIDEAASNSKKMGAEAITSSRRSKVIKYRDVGHVEFTESKRTRNINIYIRPKSPVRVTYPPRVDFQKARNVFEHKLDWVKKKVEVIQEEEKKNEHINKLFANIDRQEAGRILSERTKELADAHGFAFSCVKIRNQKTRWGSCSAENNISLNAKLVRLPDDYIDYVILHELVHTRIKNHGPRFWDELEKFVPNARSIDKEIQKYNLSFWEKD